MRYRDSPFRLINTVQCRFNMTGYSPPFERVFLYLMFPACQCLNLPHTDPLPGAPPCMKHTRFPEIATRSHLSQSPVSFLYFGRTRKRLAARSTGDIPRDLNPLSLEGGDDQYGASLRCHNASRYNVFHVPAVTLRINPTSNKTLRRTDSCARGRFR